MAGVDEWSCDIYKVRKAIIHEGRWYLEHASFAGLVDLVEALIRRTSGHLKQEHNHRHRSDAPARDYSSL